MADEPLTNEQIEPSSLSSINTTVSEPSNMPSEPLESPRNADISVSLNNDNTENISNPAQNTDNTKPVEINETEEISESAQTSETRTAQIPVNEPLASEPEPIPVFQVSQPKASLARELLVKARNMIQFRKRKKLDRIMTLFLKKSKITNDEVREFLHVSDATAERYLNALEKENKIKQVGKTGHAVLYTRI